ncbi:hypothetical protein KAH37_08080, partial [bacterium]|nr:hypothetical protein [bacterium]
LFASAVSRHPLVAVVKDGLVTFDGSCGERTRTSHGYWTNSVATSTDVKTPPKLQTDYRLHMPKVVFDNSPITIKKDPVSISFEVTADTLLDVMIFVNSKKVYYKSFKHTQQKSFKATVPVECEDIYNSIKVVARDKDKQRITSKVKTVYFPDK